MTDTEVAIKFLDNTYTKSMLAKASDEELLTLRNLIADNLQVAKVKSFKDRETAEAQTWKALEKFDGVVKAEAEGGPGVPGPKPAKAPKPPKEPKERKPAKSAMPKIVKRPTRKMFATIEKIGEHDGTGNHGRPHRWPNYTNGMTIVDVMEGDGTEPWDVTNWVGKGIMKINEATDAEYAERKAAWYKKHNLVDPDLDKESKAKAKEEAKAERERLAAEKKAAAEAAKAAKEAAKTAAPAAAE